jgi:hypothetical protein
MKLCLIVSAAIFISVASSSAFAALALLPEVPDPPFGPAKACEIAAEVFAREKRPMLVIAVEWSKASIFQPRISDGTSYTPPEAPEEWSWFITYVYSDPRMHAVTPGNERRCNSVQVVRIFKDRHIAYLIGART